MSRFLGPCLLFAGGALLLGSAVSVADWAICRASGGGQACRVAKADAVQALVGASNAALGVALQERP